MEEDTEEANDFEEEPESEDTKVAEVTEGTEETEMPPRIEEEREAAKVEKTAEEKEDIVEERVYTIPLGKAWIAPKNRRATRAMHILKDFVLKHMKIRLETEEDEEEAERLVISDGVNRRIWCRGIEKPPRKIRVRAVKDKEGTVTLYLAEGD